MLDALDKTLKQKNFLRLINQLSRVLFEKFGLLVTSRKLIDIKISLTPITTSILLSNPYVDENI